MVYVMSDLHGRYDLMLDLLEQVNFSDNDKLYILGDIVDRGKQPIDIWRYIYSHPNIILLRGNHEDMLLHFAEQNNWNVKYDASKSYSHNIIEAALHCLRNGGATTQAQIDEMSDEESAIFVQHMKELPIYENLVVNNRKFLLCHSCPVFYQDADGVDMTFDEALEYSVKSKEILWNKTLFNQSVPDDYTIVHGHCPVQVVWRTNDVVFYGENEHIIDIDCGAVWTSRLACLRLDDMKVFYTEMGERK